MADPDMEDDLFADLYNDDDRDEPAPAPVPAPQKDGAVGEVLQADQTQDQPAERIISVEPEPAIETGHAAEQYAMPEEMAVQGEGMGSEDHEERQVTIKDDGKMFIGGLNWETTDQSMKDYFSQYGEVVECTVMRDGATGRSRGFGFLTFKDPKCVNVVMVKEHILDGKLIDPKRAIPRDEQERTAKIFVGGIIPETTDAEFKEAFAPYGTILDATMMRDKITGRSRGFGFVTFASSDAVDRILVNEIAIRGRYVETKRAEPRGNMREEANEQRGSAGGFRKGRQFENAPQNQMAQNQNGQNAGMTPSMMAQFWSRMQQMMAMQRQSLAQNNMAAMNQMAMMQNPAMMQQMAAMQGYPGMQNMGGSPMNGSQQSRPSWSAQEQLSFEQQKYEREQVMMQQGQGGNSWENMYDENPGPMPMQGDNGNNNNNNNANSAHNMRGGMGGFGGRGGRGNRSAQNLTPQPHQQPSQAPANAPTGPRNAGVPGSNYRGGGRGGRRGFHPYARGYG